MKLNCKERFDVLPAAVLFDTDNTLYPYPPAHVAAMEAVKSKVALTFSVSEKEFDRVYDLARAQVKERLSGTASSHSRLLYFQRMLENLGLGSQVLWALDLEQTYWRTFLGNAILFDCVIDFLEDLRRLRIPTGIVTDLTAQIQFRKVVYFRLEQYFDYVITSEEAGHDKPHHSPFQLALEKIKPGGGAVWMIGDNPENDIVGARDSINAVTILKLGSNDPPAHLRKAADAEFKKYSDLRLLLKSIGQNIV